MKQSTKALLGCSIVAFQNIINSAATVVLAYIYIAYSDINPLDVVTIITLPSLVGVFMSFIIGPLSLRFSKKYLVIISLFLAAANGLILYFGVGVAPLWVLQLGGVLIGIMRGVTRSLLPSIITDNASAEKRSTYLGYYQAAMTTGGFCISIGIGILAAQVWQNAFLIYLIYIPIIIASFFLLPNDNPRAAIAAAEGGEENEEGVQKVTKKEGFWESIKTLPAKVWIYSIFTGLCTIGSYTFVVTFSPYIVTEFAVGGVFETTMVNNLNMAAGVLLGLVTGITIKGLKKWSVPVSLALLAVSNFIPFFIHSFASVAVGYTLMIVINIVYAYIWARTSELVPKEKSGLALSINQGFTNLGSYFCAVITVTLVTMFGIPGTSSGQMFVAGIFAAVLAVIGFVLFVIMDKPEEEKTEVQAASE